MILSHVWGLFAHPREEFLLIQKEQANRPTLYVTYILILAAIPPVAIFIGNRRAGSEIELLRPQLNVASEAKTRQKQAQKRSLL